jgi:HK97 family phage major capsid protein
MVAFLEILDREIENRAVALDLGTSEPVSGARGWVNAATGQPVRLYKPDEKIAADRGARSEVTLGALLDGLIFGAKRPEIRAALEEGTDSAGGYSVPTFVLPQFIDRLRAKTQFINAGSRVLLLDGKTRIVRSDTDPTAAWRAESSAITEGEPSFSAVDLLPKSLAVLVKVSREVLQDSVNIQDALEASLIGAMSGELDRAAFFGAGTATEPQGLFNIAGINSVSMGTNGGTPTSYDDLLDCIYELELDNSGQPTASVWHPRTARTYRKLKDTTNQPLRAPEPVASLPKLSTTSVPIAQDQGTATGVCSTVLMGDFTQAILGLRESLNITILKERFADTGQLAFVAHIRADVAFAHPESFVKLIGVKP